MGIGGSIDTLGLATSLSYAAARAGSVSGMFRWHRYRIVSVPLGGMPSMPRGHSARLMSAAELSVHTIDASRDVQSARYAAGLACIAAFAGDQLVAVNWLAHSRFDEDEVRVRYLLPDDAAWDTGLWIPPERRMGRAFAAIWAGTASWLAEHGFARSMSRIADYNIASLQSHQRMGGRQVASLSALGAGRLQLCLGAAPMLSCRTTPIADFGAL